MKKTLAIICIVILAASLFSGCTDRSGTTSDASVSEPSGDGDTTEEIGDRPSLEEAAASNALINQDQIKLVQFEEPGPDDQVAVVTTNMGRLVIALYPGEAPLAVENFISLANDEFYNGKVFHFVQEGFLVQSGAVNSNGTGSKSSFTNESGEQKLFEVEKSWNTWNFRGAVSMVSNSDNLNGSQFVIVHADEIYGYNAADLQEAKFPNKVIEKYESLGGVPHRDNYDTVFGMVIEGMDVVDAMVATPTDASGVPSETILIETVSIVRYADVEPEDDAELSEDSGEAAA